MSMHVYSDESWFPDHEVQTVWFVYGTATNCALLTSSIWEILEQYNCSLVKRSKIRAKKQLFSCAGAILWQTKERLWQYTNCWILVTAKGTVYEQYRDFFDYLWKTNKGLFYFFPDKNLALQWHTKQHLFSWDDRFLEIQPVQTTTTPLLIVADLLSGMLREAKERPEIFKNDISLISYKPDYYKVLLRKNYHSLLGKMEIDTI